MRIARPRKPNVPFKRKRSPPPQATKLLTYSMVAGIVFIVLLGIVFLPRMLVEQPRVAIVQLRLDSNVTRLDVIAVTAVLDLARFNATYRDNGFLASLPPGLAGGNSTLSFVDANTTGLLDPGDYFDISCDPTATHTFEIFQVNVNRRVGFLRWTGCTAT